MKMKIFSILAFALFLLSSCGSGDRCFECAIGGGNPIDVCESTYQEQAALNNIEVNSLDEYLNLIGPNGTGFVCTEKSE